MFKHNSVLFISSILGGFEIIENGEFHIGMVLKNQFKNGFIFVNGNIEDFISVNFCTQINKQNIL